MTRTRRLLSGAIALAAVLSFVTACGGSSSGGGTDTVNPGTSPDSALAAKVPAAVKSDGVITIGVDSTYAPSEFLAEDGTTVQGFDVDVFDAVAAKLGLKTRWVTADFGAIIESVKSGKFEIGVSSFTINADREKQATMISYFDAGTQWATQKGNPSGISVDNACGKHVAVQKDTVQVDDLAARSKMCTKAGKAAIKIDQYRAQDDATSAAISGKAAAMLADSPVCAYAVAKTNGQLELLGDIYDSAPYGYVLPKTATDFADAIKGGLELIIADGTYKKALDKWGVGQGAISTPEINPTV
ncbi:MAG: polar amino acid transport system substrate-binding protein [Frankiaceae bacterium]|nr:polar amino acid transport system substrate-binding protein [Frankiaceae bacterium]